MAGTATNETAAHPARSRRARMWIVLFLVYTLIAVLLTGYRYLDDLTREHPGTFYRRVLEEGTGVYSVFLLLPFVFPFARVYLFERKGWVKLGLFHVGAAVLFSAAHTTMMDISRHFLAPLMGLGPYDYGIMTYRYPMEFSNDLIGFTVIVGAYSFYQRLRIAQAQQLAAAEIQTKLVQAQLENLRLQLQPHFLFNTLNTISSVMYEDVRAADAMITQLSDLLRLTLRASRAHEIPLAEELEITRLYLDLMQKRFENKFRVTYSIDPSLNSSLVPQLILQPLLENSLRHGMKPGSSAMDLSIAAHRENGSLILQVSDSGSGLGEIEPSGVFGRGLGLSNIRDRLAHLYGDRQQLSIFNRPSGGAEVTLRVPLHSSGHISQTPE
jgi:two-component system, LytTR family, sensor kinase